MLLCVHLLQHSNATLEKSSWKQSVTMFQNGLKCLTFLITMRWLDGVYEHIFQFWQSSPIFLKWNIKSHISVKNNFWYFIQNEQNEKFWDMFKHCEGRSSSKMEATVFVISWQKAQKSGSKWARSTSNESKQIFHNITHLQRFFSYLHI